MIFSNVLFRKLLTRPIHRYEITRRYPIREKAFELPAVAVNPDPSTILAILTVPKTIFDAVWVAQSFLRHLPRETGLTIVVDGQLSVELSEKVTASFPGVRIDNTRRLMEQLAGQAPNLIELGESNPMGRKLAVTLCLQQKYDLIYSDSDVLCFGEMPELHQAIVNRGPAMYIQDVDGLNPDQKLLDYIKTLDYDYALTLNGGLQFIPSQSLQINLAEEILSARRHNPESWFVEQTLLALLVGQTKSEPLPKSKYVVSTDRQFYFEPDVSYRDISVRHFVTPVRHLMYSKGMPIIWKKLEDSN